MEGGALLKDDFVKFAENYVLFCHITTHVAGEKHGDLLEQKGGQGFPHMVFMDAEGNVLATHDDDRTGEAFAKTGEKARKFLALKAKAEKGDKTVKVDYFIARLELGQLKTADAEKELKTLGTLSKEQKAKVDALLVDGAIREALDGVDDEESTIAAGKKCAEMKKAGKIPSDSSEVFAGYWDSIMAYAESQKNAALFEEALKLLKTKFAQNPRAMQYLKTREDALNKLKEKK